MRLFLTFLPALACAGLMFGCIRMMLPHRKDEMPDPATVELQLRVAELEQRLEQSQSEARSDPSHQDA